MTGSSTITNQLTAVAEIERALENYRESLGFWEASGSAAAVGLVGMARAALVDAVAALPAV